MEAKVNITKTTQKLAIFSLNATVSINACGILLGKGVIEEKDMFKSVANI